MSKQAFPFAVRAIGFSAGELSRLAAQLVSARQRGFRYVLLEEDNLQDPDLYLVDGEDLRALAAVSDLRPGDLRPVLLVGAPAVEMPCQCIPRPVEAGALFAGLDALVERRADALSRLQASDVVRVPERRRRPRPDLDLGDPARYERMRRKIPENGVVLVVDRHPALHEAVAAMLRRQGAEVVRVDSETAAVGLREQRQVSLLLINTSTPHVDPYRLCWALQEQGSQVRHACVLLVGPHFVYDPEQARFAGVDGFLRKPLGAPALMSVLKRYLPARGASVQDSVPDPN